MASTDLMATGSRDVNGVYKFESGTIWQVSLLALLGFSYL
jgi:hypothetical protein